MVIQGDTRSLDNGSCGVEDLDEEKMIVDRPGTSAGGHCITNWDVVRKHNPKGPST